MFPAAGRRGTGDVTGLPKCQLPVLPGTMHVTVPSRADLLGTIVPAFLDA